MRVAVIADIHGNIDALEAVLRDVRVRGADRIVNLGDCVSGPLWPRETMDLLQGMGLQAGGLPTVRGNHDRWVAQMPREKMGSSDAFAHDRLTSAQRCALDNLPARLDLAEGIAAVHGTAGDDNQYLLEDVVAGRLALSSSEDIAARVGHETASVLLCGHSHQPRLAQGPGGLMIINPGSVGCPAYVDPTPPTPHISETGSPHARYALLTKEAGASRWQVNFIAVAYDWDRASAQAASNDRPQWAHALATGYVS
jgi:predicted phosphodiesterase